MIPYWILFAVYAVGAFVYQPSSVPGQRNVMPFFWVAGICLALMIGLRWEIGVDWGNYARMYEEMRWLGPDGVFGKGDPLFYFPMQLFRKAGLHISYFMMACAAIFTIGLCTFSARQPNPWLAVLVAVPFLVIGTAMSGVRQATAIGFVFLALNAFQDRNPLRFLLWTACAAGIHASAIILLPLAGLSFARSRLQAGALVAVMGVMAFIVLRGSFQQYADDYLIERELDSAGVLYRLAMSIIPALIFLIFSKKFLVEARQKTLWRNFSLLAVLSVPILFVIPSTTVIDRLLLYAFPMQMFVLSTSPYIFGSEARKRFLFIFLIMMYLATVLFVFLNFADNRFGYIPYRFWPFVDDVVA
jgi:hypothetical protein